jgi:hypothetical protein
MEVVKSGDFMKIEFIGGGGQGDVWLLKRISDGKVFAGKFIRCDRLADSKIYLEAQLLISLDHPALVKGFGMGLPSNAKEPMLILMELLDHHLDISKLDSTSKAKVLMQVGKGLKFLHSKDIVHLDLKPGNILLTKDGNAKIGDFGSAKVFELSQSQTSIALTQGYASPEALDGVSPSPSMDVYSYSMLAYELATGQSAFDPKLPPAKLIMAIMGGHVPKVSADVAPVLREVIEAGWQKDPAARPTMEEICVKLGAVGWNVFPDADVVTLAEAELALPMDETVSLATIKFKVERLEAEVGGLRARTSRLETANARLQEENADLRGETFGLESETSRLRGKNAWMKDDNTGLKAEVAGLKGDNARLMKEVGRLKGAEVGTSFAPFVGIAPAAVGQGTIAPGTLFESKWQEIVFLGLSWRGAELLFACNGGQWDYDAVAVKVAGKGTDVGACEFASRVMRRIRGCCSNGGHWVCGRPFGSLVRVLGRAESRALRLAREAACCSWLLLLRRSLPGDLPRW